MTTPFFYGITERLLAYDRRKISIKHYTMTGRIVQLFVFHFYESISHTRDVPDSLHHKLKARADMEGLSLSDYLISVMSQSAERPTVSELRERLHKRSTVIPTVPPAKVIREERDSQ
jgi:hypothetical protein